MGDDDEEHGFELGAPTTLSPRRRRGFRTGDRPATVAA